MTVLASFAVDSEELPIGRLVRNTSVTGLEFERIVPTEDALMPFFWVTGDEFPTFERALAESSFVADFDLIDRVGVNALYRVQWKRGKGMLIQGIVDTEGVILRGDIDSDTMRFLVRFPDHDHLGQFYNYCIEHAIDVEMLRVYSLTDRSERALEFGLTPDQREALVLAIRRGYFSTPRETTLDELAAVLGISQQAISQRIRGGTEKVMIEALGIARNEN